MTFTVGGKHRLSRALTGLLVVCAVFTTGCLTATGGGWIPSAFTPTDKATFGFTARCRTMQQNGNSVAELYDGQLEWHDGPVRIHGKVEPVVFLTQPELCGDVSLPGLLSFGGTYEPQDGGLGGFFEVQVEDLGEPGKISGDFISIKLVGVEHGGYTNMGTLRGGNIQVQ